MTESKPPAKKTTTAKPDDLPKHATIEAALVGFQAEVPTVAKDKTATVTGRDGTRGYTYDYASLPDVARVVYPILARHGLAFTCLPRQTSQGGYELAGRLIHTSGEHLEGSLPLYGNTAQQLGSSLTYARRYLLSALTGVVTDDDDDAAAANQAPPARPYQEPGTTSRRSSVDAEDPWATPETRDQLLERLDRYAKSQQIDREQITAKVRRDRGDWTLDQFNAQPIDDLRAFVNAVGKWVDERVTETGGGYEYR